MKRILLLTHSLNKKTGWGTVACELYTVLRRHCSVAVIDANNAAITNKSWRPSIIDLYKDHFAICKTYQGQQIDCILCCVETYLPLAYFLKKRMKIKNLIQIGHGTLIYYPFINSMLCRFFARAINAVVVPSRFTYCKVKEWYKKTVEIIKWGVNLDDYHRIEYIKKEKAFIFVGQLRERKGIEYLARAYSKLVKSISDLKLYIIGSDMGGWKEKVEEISPVGNIIFAGQVKHNDLLTFYSKSMCCILPSINTDCDFEGFGLVHLEANACGIPSIGTVGTANEEVIIDGKTGFLCPQRDVECLYYKMKLILEDDSLYERLCENALRHAHDNTWKKAGRKLMDLIESI